MRLGGISRPVIVWAVVPPGNDERNKCGNLGHREGERWKGAKNDCPPTHRKETGRSISRSLGMRGRGRGCQKKERKEKKKN